jgi:hypothetical protein
LVAGLAEASEEALQAIDGVPAISQLLIALVTAKATPSELVDDALSSLLILSEDNPQLADMVVNAKAGTLDYLLKLKELGTGTGVLACGVLHNLFAALDWHDNNVGRNNSSDAVLVPTLSKALEPQLSHSVDILQLALEILSSIGTGIQQSLQKGSAAKEEWNGIKDDDPMDEEEAGDDNDDDEPNEEEDEEMDEDDVDADMEADMDMVTGVDDDVNGHGSIDDLPTLKALAEKAVPQAIRLATLAIDSDEKLRIQGHALGMLNNISWSVSCIDFSEGHNAGILKAWSPMAKRVWENVIAAILATDTADVELATQITSLAWAISRSLGGRVPLAGEAHRKFMTLYQATKGMPAEPEETDSLDPFQTLSVKCIGVLGQLALSPAPIAVNREIGIFLVTVLSALPETPVADAVESLNQLLDIYGDEELPCDKAVFWKDNFLSHLEEVVPKLKAAAKKIDKRTMLELRTRTDEAIMNLRRFIQYKKKHRPE